jgi:hypothetical protein
MTSKTKKKRIDFSVRPRANKNNLPATSDEWVQGRKDPEQPDQPQEAPPQKRLTLNLPVGLHTAFKGLCVRQGITIQDKVQFIIERELAAAPPAEEGAQPL